MKWKTRALSLMLAIMLIIAPCTIAYAERQSISLADIAAQCAQLIGLQQVDTLESITLANNEFEPTLLLDGTAVYGVRFTSGAHAAQSAIELANDIIALAKTEYGVPHTYATQTRLSESAENPVTDAEKAAANMREYWSFAWPEYFRLAVYIERSAAGEYSVALEFAQSKLPGAEYMLSDALWQYAEFIGNEHVRDLPQMDMLKLFDVLFERQWILQGDKVCGIKYSAAAMDANGAAICVKQLFLQICTEYGVPLETADDEKSLMPLYDIADRLAEGELSAYWNLPFADKRLNNFGIRLTAGADDNGAHIDVEYAAFDTND